MASIKIENLSKIFGSRQAIEKAKTMLNDNHSKEEIVCKRNRCDSWG